MMKQLLAPAGAVLILLTPAGASAQPADGGHPDIRLFLQAGAGEPEQAEYALEQLGDRWRDGYAGIVWDMAWLQRPPNLRGFARFFTLIGFLEQQTGRSFGADLQAWQRWMWGRPYEPHPDHGFFKASGTARSTRASPSFSRGEWSRTSGSTRSSGEGWP